MASNNRKSKKASPKRAKTPSPPPASAPKEDTGEWPQWMNVFMTCVKFITLASAAALTTFGIAYIVRGWGDRFVEYPARVSFRYAWAVFKAATMYLTVLSTGWITFYVVADVFAKAAKQDPVPIKFTEAMNHILPFAMGGMWIGHLIRFILSMPDLDRILLRVWLITVVATNGPAMALYVRVRRIADRHEAARKASTAAKSRAKAEVAQAS